MNGIHKTRGEDLEKSFPGCMGTMINLFDFGPGMTGNKLLTYNEHQNGSLPSKGRTDVVNNASNCARDRTDDKPIGFKLARSSSASKSSGTPMKMLIAKELTKETESKQNPPSVIAKLMGLDSLPVQANIDLRHTENEYLDKRTTHELKSYQEQLQYKDVYEVWQKSPQTSYVRDKSPRSRVRHNEQHEKKMALVRQKFIEAKRLSTNEKLRQSKEFQDALEVLSSNKDLFLKFLQEPNSLFSQHLYEQQSIPPPPQKERITVLKPSRTIENIAHVGLERKSEKQKKKLNQLDETRGLDQHKPGRSSLSTSYNGEDSALPTRIVVLKPTPGKVHDIKAMVFPPPLSPGESHSKDLCDLDNDETRSSREVAKEITRQIRESVDGWQKEETVRSSVFSNGYVGDGSSFNRLENEFVEEDNLSDSEVMTPTSRYSWDYANRFGSPYSSSFSRASYSPESSVTKEATKRLSDRWAVMASNRIGREQRQVRRSSSTLGEMLASDVEKSVRSEMKVDRGHGFPTSKSCGGEQDLDCPLSSFSNIRGMDEVLEDSPKNLLRSKSLPVSSTRYGTKQDSEVSNPENGKLSACKEVQKSKNGKSSFKGKLSGLFFSRNKKPSSERSNSSLLVGDQDQFQSAIAKLPYASNQSSPITDSIPQFVTDFDFGVPRNPSTVSIVEPKQEALPNKALLGLAKPWIAGNQCPNWEQPNPIPDFQRPIEDGLSTTRFFCDNIKLDLQGESMQLHSLKSNIISKSPPIGSLARSLSRDISCSDIATPDPLNSTPHLTEAEEEQERFLFIKSLLSSTNLDWNDHSNVVFNRRHSLETPLDPSLLDKILNQRDYKEQWQGTRCRKRRSDQKLLFDIVNAVLIDIMCYGSETSLWTRISSNSKDRIGESVTLEEVWTRVKECFSSETKCCLSESGDSNSLVVERVIRKEVTGRGWTELMRSEVDSIGKQIEEMMMQELVDETLFEFSD